MKQLLSVDQLPDGVSVDDKSFRYKNKIIYYDKIISIRIFSSIQKMSINLIPMPTTIESLLTIVDKNNDQ